MRLDGAVGLGVHMMQTAIDGTDIWSSPSYEDRLAATMALGFMQNAVPLTLADPNRPGCPMIYVNQAFVRLTGYDADECVGRNCRFLQGPDTDPAAVETVSLAVAERRSARVDLLNYRKDGTPFWNGLHIGPIHDHLGRTVAIFGSQTDVTALRTARHAERQALFHAAEVAHRVKNAFQVIESMVKLSGRGGQVPQLIEKISTRVRAIATAHASSLAQPGRKAVLVSPVVEDVLDPYQGLAGNRIRVEGPPVHVFPGTVSVLALVLHELATNAVRHGALSRPGGHVTVGWTGRDAALGEMTEVVFSWEERGRGRCGSR